VAVWGTIEGVTESTGPREPRTLTAHPVRLRRVATGIAIAVMALSVLVAVLLGSTTSEGVVFGPADQIAMVVLGGIVAGGVLLLARPEVSADATGLRVRNILVTKQVPWAVVREVAFRDGSPWAVLELEDDEQLAVLAVQASDGERAVVAVRGLRALHAQARGADERSHEVT
jgi:hypothetical protein